MMKTAIFYTIFWFGLLLGCVAVFERVFIIAKSDCQIAGGYLGFGMLLGIGASYCYRQTTKCLDWIVEEAEKKKRNV